MKTDDRYSQFQRSLAGVVLAALLLALWGAATPGSLPSGSTEPVIDSVTPASGEEGTLVTIRGANFGPSVGAVQGTSGVSFNGVWSTPSNWSDGEIRVAVPPGASTGEVVVTVSSQASAGVEFTVTGMGGPGPAIGTVSPLQGMEGTVVTIRGGGFGSTAEMGGVSFNGVWAAASSWSEGEIRVAVPADAGTGPVVVTANGQSSNGVAFMVPDSGLGEPSVHSLSSGSGPEGTVVTIEGENFGPSIRVLEGTSGVSFNGVWGEPTYWSETQIQVPVPEGAPSGLVTVTAGGEASNGLAFVVERAAPVIEAVDASLGLEGTRVEISGRNFGPAMEAVQGWSGVSFDGSWGVVSYWSDREIRVSTPAGVSGGLVVVTSVGQESNGIPFTAARSKGMPRAVAAASTARQATPTLKSLTPDNGPVGTDVKIKGKNFGDQRGSNTVTFNGTQVSDYVSWSNKRIDVEVPVGATTGDVVVTIGGVDTDGIEFTVTAGTDPSISMLDPDSGPEGTSVEITGVNFGASQGTGTVTFNGTGATPTNWSDTSITVAVPMGATTGEVVVTVEGTASAGVSFTVAPAIGSLSPVAGPEGTTVEITGTSFGAAQGTSTVTFNGTSATATSWSDASITVTVPAGATTGNVVVTVDGTASAGASFTVTPAIGSLSPVAGPEGTTVEITGTSFGASKGTSAVTFNGTSATATSWSDTSITVTVPANATTGEVVVTVGGEASNGVTFTVGTDPVISGLNPDSGPAGTTVAITGANFGASQGTSSVTFNGAEATPTDWSDTSITVTVPANATTGPVVVTVDGTASNGVTFSVKPVIAGLSRVSGPEGTTVVITGTGFGASQGTSSVTFNGTGATPTGWSDTSITVTVPAGAATGSVVVTVDATPSDGVAFTVTPEIGSLSPIAGPEGTTVVITGTSFGAMQGTSTVTFNGISATPTSWSSTSITVAVPAGATSGNVVVTVGGEASNGASFTVGTDPIVTSLSPALGQVETTVVIGGVNFGASQGTGTVTFNGVAATPTSWSDASITVTVPASAATGPVVVTVGGESSNQVTFTVTGPPPEINKLKPAEGGVGDSVKVKGEYFGTAQGTSTVTFNGLKATARKWGDDKITVNVPAGARTGPVVVTVEGQASNPVTFSVTGSSPSIISLDPTSGEVGTVVTIAGVHFGAAQGTSTVTFNGVAATATSWSDTSITAPAPAGAATGPVVVTVGGQASNGVTFSVTLPAPSITLLDPVSGRNGASVTITGEHFGATQGSNTVTFNGVAATPTSWSNTSITTAVPTTATTGNVVVTVGGQVSNPMAFTVVSVPAISSLNPDKGPEGTSVTIAGGNFGDPQGTSTVTFNGVSATAASWSDTSITAAVPAGATTGGVVVTVGGEASDGAEFTVTPTIGALSPDSGPVGTSVEITGTSFGATQGTSTVTFNGTSATPASWSDTSITAAVPAGATTGDVVVTVGGEASDGVEFTVTPTIGALSPDSGPEGTSVEITGTSFGATQGTSTVTFNGTSATPASWSDTSITAAVPAGATTGDVVVTVGGEASDGVEFTVTPAIGSLSPDSGPEGTSVEITGTSFGATQGTSTIAFNGTAATATSWSDTSITAAVPAGATTGDVVVTVGGEASDGVEFTVTPAIGSLSPDSGPEGTSVDISGTSFGASQGTSTVSFNGTAATATSWSDTSITVAVPAGATTGDVVVTVDSQASNGASFTVTPAISSLSPDTGPVQTTVDISGTSFGASQGTGTVTFNGVVATASSWDDTSITVTVPSGATTGPVVVTVDGEASNGVTFTVRENRAPEAEQTIPAQTVNKGESVDLTVSSYFSDPDEDELEYTVSSSDTAKVTVGVNGAVVTLTGVAKGEAAVTVTASDGSLTAQQAFTVTVPNGAPEAVDTISARTVNKGESSQLTVSSYFSDPDEDTLGYSVVTSDTAKVTVGVNGAVVTLTGVAKGDATVTVTASDGNLTTQQAFTVTVPNGAPEAVGTIAAQTVDKGESADLTVSSYFSDPDEDTLEYTVASSDTAKVTVGINGAVVTLTGVAKGKATVTVTASDGNLTAEQAFTVTVPNGAPEAEDTISAQTVNKGESSELTVSSYFSDPDEDTLEFSVVTSDTAKVTVGVSGAVVTLTGVAKGEARVTVTASDGNLTAQQAFTVTVPNRAPEAVGTIGAQTVNKGSNAPVTVSGNFRDPDMDSLSYTASSSDTSKVSVSVNGEVVTVAGVAKGSARVTVTASDGNLTAQQAFTVTVPNRAPEAVGTIGAQTVNKGSNAPVTVSGNFRDPDMDGLSYTASSSDTSKVSVSVNGAVVTVTGVAKGSATVTVTASDGNLTAQQGFTVTVPNRAPEAVGTIAAQTVNKGSNAPVTVSGNFSDPDMDSLSYTVSSSDTSKVSVSVSGAVVTVAGVAQGRATVTVTASDGSLTAQQGFTVTVPNRAPVKVGDVSAQSVNKKSSKGVSVSGKFSDADMDSLSYTASSSNTSKVSVTVSGSTVTIRGVSQTSSAVTVRVTASDGHGGSAQLSFGVTVPNRAPVKVGDVSAQSVNKKSSKGVSVSGKFSDADMDSLTYTARSSNTSKVTVSVSGSTVTITGKSQGSATVRVTASDGHGGSAQLSFGVTVPNRRPTCSGIPDQTVNKKASKNLNLSSYFSDADMDSLSYSASSSDTFRVTVSVSGSTLKITGKLQGSARVTVTASDGHGGSVSCSFDVDVPNRVPNCSSIPGQTIYVGETASADLDSYCSDPDMDTLEYSAPASTNDAVVTPRFSEPNLTGTGVSKGKATVSATVSDGNGGETTARYEVTVKCPPAADGTIPDQSVYKKSTKTVTVSGYFDNCNGDPLTYTASSSDTSKVKVSNGATVTLTGVSQTSSAVTVTVTASDGTRTAQQTFDVEVPNRDPEKEGTIADQTVSKGSSKQLTVSGYFSDPDMDSLRYSARSSATGKATVSVSGSKVTISGVAEGTATVTVTAEDGHGGEVDQEFDVTVTVPTPSISSISPPLQPPDTQVTISGSNFGSSQGSVSFGGDSVTDISSWSNTSIRCFIPVFASAGTVSVTVTTSGNKTSSGYSYTITGRSPVRGQCGDEEGCEGEEEPEKEGSGSEEGGDSEGSEDPPGDAG